MFLLILYAIAVVICAFVHGVARASSRAAIPIATIAAFFVQWLASLYIGHGARLEGVDSLTPLWLILGDAFISVAIFAIVRGLRPSIFTAPVRPKGPGEQ
jgi:hypothetical protein